MKAISAIITLDLSYISDFVSFHNNVIVVGGLANYDYFSMDQSILHSLEKFDEQAPKVAVWQIMDSITGGPEALIQLTLAFHSWMPTRTYVVHNGVESKNASSQWAEIGYPDIAEVQTMEKYQLDRKLKRGDVYIIPQVVKCPKELVDIGVEVYIWHLSGGCGFTGDTMQKMSSRTKENLAAGCKIISHSHFMANVGDGLNLSRSHVFLPYLSRKKTHYGSINNDKREDIILQNNDHAKPDLSGPLRDFCDKRDKKCEVVLVKGFSREQLVELYSKAKVIVATCLNGAERSALEAITHGVILLTAYCDHGTDFRDFPLPREHMVEMNLEGFDQILENMLSSFENEQRKLKLMRDVYRSYGAKSLAKDTKRFMLQYQESWKTEEIPLRKHQLALQQPDMFHPILFGQSDGWNGTTHNEGMAFCRNHGTGPHNSICSWYV